MPRRYITGADVARMRTLYEDREWSAEEIAEEIGTSAKTVCEHLHRAGVRVRRQGPYNTASSRRFIDARNRRIRRAHAEGVRTGELMERFGLSSVAIWKIVNAEEKEMA